MKRLVVALLGLVAACGGAQTSNLEKDASIDATTFSPVDASIADAADADAGPDPCAPASVPPSTLECTGLYADFAAKTISPDAQSYAPAIPLWSDNAEKQRWIKLPLGTKIDVSNPNEWIFPIGTKLFKEFVYAGKRVETRLFQKVTNNFWVHATYAWNADDSATAISYGQSVAVDSDGGTWTIPTSNDCDSCHRGRSDHILGFDQVNLGLAGAKGLTLLQLVVRDLITPAPSQVNLRIGDDGTSLDAPALGWLHVNCGVTCHNANENALGYGAGLLLRLDPSWLDGTPARSSWDPLRTTINVLGVSGSLAGHPRIVPGDPSASAIVQLIGQRGTLQMPPPPLSSVVDSADVAAVVAWIQHMPGVDGGSVDGSDAGDGGIHHHGDAGREGGIDDAGSESGADDSGVITDNDAFVDAANDADDGSDASDDDAGDGSSE